MRDQCDRINELRMKKENQQELDDVRLPVEFNTHKHTTVRRPNDREKERKWCVRESDGLWLTRVNFM